MNEKAQSGQHRKVAAFDPVVLLQRPQYDPRMKRPITTVAGSVLVLLSATVGVFWLVSVVLVWQQLSGRPVEVDIAIEGLAPGDYGLVLGIIVAFLGAVVVAYLVLAVFIFLGYNWARIVVMTFAVISICSAFVAWWAQDRSVRFDTTIWSVAVDILVLLALSSRSAAAYGRRHSRSLRSLRATGEAGADNL